MKAIICRNAKKVNDISGVIADIIAKLGSLGIGAELAHGVCAERHADCDIMITVGGDGTILHHGKTAARLGIPLLGINMGRLGFMTSLEMSELSLLEKLRDIRDIAGSEYICSRMMMNAHIGGRDYLALNDAVFCKDVSSKLPEFTVTSGGHVVSALRADGLILSTPTGSTAYALSAGGPIIEPWLDCIELTPLCAHSLFGRAMIFSTDNPVEIKFDSTPDNHDVFVSVDGEAGIPLAQGESAVISKSELRLSLVDLKGGSFHRAVKDKLMKPL
jgi:NAD+ kinase